MWENNGKECKYKKSNVTSIVCACVWTYRGVVWAGGDGVAARVEADTIDIRLVALKHLTTLARTQVPHHQRLVTTLHQTHRI